MDATLKQPQRLPTPSLRQQYYTCRKVSKLAGSSLLGGSVSLPNLSENAHHLFSGQTQVLTFEDTSLSPEIPEAGSNEVTPPRKTPLRAQRFGSSIVPRDRAQQTLPRHIELCDDKRAVQSAQSSLAHLGAVIRDFESRGRGPEVNATQPHRRMRGLDFLYSVRNDSAMLPKPEDEGGMKAREEDDEEVRADARRARVWKLLRSVPYFMTLESSYSGLTWKLSKKCQFFQEAAGQVVFRQDDPAGNCYVIVSGKVAVKIFKEAGQDEDQCPTPREAHEPRMYWYQTLTETDWGGYRDARATKGEQEQQLRKYFAWAEPKKPVKAKPEPDSAVKNLRRRSMQSVLAIVVEAGEAADTTTADDDPERDMTMYEQLQQEDCPRYKTAEGHTTWCPKESCLGQSVVTLGTGAIFGEMALQNDKPRAATIECRTKCRLMILEKQHLLHVLMEVMARIRFFNDRLPGISEAEYRMDHPSQYFSLRNFPQGYQFMYEGIVMTDPALYVLKSGTVEFRRYRRISQNPAYVLSNLPLVESAWKSLTARPRTGIAGSNRSGARPKSRALQSRSGRKQLTPRDDFGNEVVCDVMHAEGVFCTLPFFPLFCVEPFSVVATSPVEVFHIAADSIKKLGSDYLPILRKHLLLQMKERIRKLPSGFAEVEEDTAQEFDSKGQTFYKTVFEESKKHQRKYKPTYEEHLSQLQIQGGHLDRGRPQQPTVQEHEVLEHGSQAVVLPMLELGNARTCVSQGLEAEGRQNESAVD